MLEKQWETESAITPEAEWNLTSFHPVMRQLLFNRGLGTEREAAVFLNAESITNTDPFQLKGMEAVVDRLRFALEHQQAIAIYGDYDVDGVTATALLVQILRASGATVRPYIPNRFDEGYGLNNEALDSLKSDGVQVVITVDCGIRSPEEAAYAREIGIDLVISDHHHPLDGALPPAFAVISPKQPDDSYPDKDLAGVGIAYKIAEALLTSNPNEVSLSAMLDLVALGTVADLAPLVGENRHLVRNGLEEIRKGARQGLFSLANISGVTIRKTTASQIGFILGPRLNAAGRLESALGALDLLITSDSIRAGHLAQQLDSQNRQRQALTREMQERAEFLAREQEANPLLLFAADSQFNPGVIGLAASRLTEAYYRPAIVATTGPEYTRGSCRSIPEFNITNALDQCKDLLVRHGGHAAAAGFTVRNEHLPELVLRLKTLAETELGSMDLRPTLMADLEIGLSSLSFDLLKQLEKLEPTGYGNREAVFISRNARVRGSRTVGVDGKHIKLTLEDERGITTDAIGFRLGHLQTNLTKQVDIAYTIEANEYGGRTTLQLNLRDIKPTDIGT